MPEAAAPPKLLRLLAEDADDLAVISAALQDAVAKIGDIAYSPKARQLTIGLNRYRWEAGGERIRAGLQIASVTGIKSRKLRRDAKDAVVEILAITFEPGDPPGGVVNIAFAGGGDMQLTVECLDAVLADVSVPWPTPRQPTHEGL
jgi:hypothetical protein